MGISRDSRHKRRLTGGRMPIHKKKRAFEKARQPSHTRLGGKRIHTVRGRGGNLKFRALRLDSGNYAWGSESVSRKTRILNVVYNATNNELVRTNTLTLSTVVLVDATPFKVWYQRHYGLELGKKKEDKPAPEVKSKHALAKQEVLKKAQEENSKTRILDPALVEQFKSGRLFAIISSRPGQSGRADGYILEGQELEFYKKKMDKKKGK